MNWLGFFLTKKQKKHIQIMAYNEKLTNRIRKAFTNAVNMEEKKMFRGIAFMMNEKMCVTVGDNEMMCRIDPELHEASLEKKGCRTVIMKGRKLKGWVYISEEGMKTEKEFNYWIGLALDFNKTAKASKKNKK